MALNQNYVIAPSLQQYFVDKDTGFPLSGGKIYFWQDNNRSIPKPIFQLTGSPPNYSYAALPNPCILNSSGLLVDGSGNIIVPYYYPLDANGNAQLYFIQIFSDLGVPQQTIEAWPNVFLEGDAQSDSTLNLIPNGQFLLHNNIPANVLTSIPAGQVTTPVTVVAQGGWTFERPVTSTATDNVSFFKFPAYTANPSSSPRYAFQLTTNGASPSDSFKDLRIKFNDVNKFASTTQSYVVFFSGLSASGGTIPVSLNVIKNYGTGGSAEEVVNITSFNITSVQSDFSYAFIFGSNVGKIIGPNNDDFVQIALSFPVNTSYTGRITDVVMFIGDVNVTTFPTITNSDFIDRSLVPPVADYNGFNLALPLIFTKSGLSYDTSQIGKIYQTSLYYPEFGELLCDGATYRTDAYSPDGIPYKRLRDKLIQLPSDALVHNMPVFGTGRDYVAATHVNDDGTFYISTQKPGLQPLTADGAAPTGFTFTSVAPGKASSSTLNIDSYCLGNGNSYYVFCNAAGAVPFDNFSTTGTQTINAYPNTYQGEIVGSAQTQQLIKIISNAVPPAGSYININTPSATIRPWFTLDGAGSSPGGGGILVQINMLSTMGLQDTAYAISQALSGYQVATVKTVPGVSIPPNSYFTFYASGQLYYVWYSLNGLGTDPAVSGGIGIPVTYLTAHAAITIMKNTYAAINGVCFAVPDLRGWTIKGWDMGAGIDKNILNRYEYAQTRFTSDLYPLRGYIGSYQNNSLLSHSHQPILGSLVSGGSPNRFTTNTYLNSNEPVTTFSTDYIDNTGNAQNDVKNVYLNYVIKY